MALSKYVYIPLSELANHVHQKVNVLGVVIGQPLHPASTSFYQYRQETILICDQSCEINSPIRCTIRIYKRSTINDYNTPSAGTIVRLHRMHVLSNNGTLFGYVYQSEDMLQFLIDKDGEITRTTTAASYTFNETDDQKAMELHDWYERTKLQVPAEVLAVKHSNYCTFSEICKDDYYDVCVQVIGWWHDEKMYQHQMVVRVWDGTMPRGKPKLSQLQPDVYDTLGCQYRMLERSHFVDVIVFDEHITAARQLKTGDRVIIQNVRVIFKGSETLFWLQSSGKSFHRGIWPITDVDVENNLQERLGNVLSAIRDNESLAVDYDDVSDIEKADEQNVESTGLNTVSQNDDVRDSQEKRNVKQAGLENTQQKKIKSQSALLNPFKTLGNYNTYFKVIPRPT